MDTIMRDIYSERVGRMAALLDSKKPGWFEQVDLNTLNLNDIDKCVLGQVYGAKKWYQYLWNPLPGYGTGLRKLGLTYNHNDGLAFAGNSLHKAFWIEAIEVRCAAAAQASVSAITPSCDLKEVCA